MTMQIQEELQLLIDRYNKEWNRNGMGAAISLSRVISDFESINKSNS